MRKIYFPIFSDAVRSKIFSLYRENPGVGGTQFTAIQLALHMANSYPAWRVIIANNENICMEDSPENISQELFDDVQKFFEKGSFSDSDLIVTTATNLKKVDFSSLKKIEKSLICWSHHPFDSIARSMARYIELRSVVCVGVYQFYSNQNINSKVHHIQNIFTLPNKQDNQVGKLTNPQSINICFLGALVPEKGFLEVAKIWEKIKESFSEARLHVIGSSATYGLNSTSLKVPTTSGFEKKILKFIPEKDIDSGKVVFYGNLGEEKFDVIKRCDVAILNPTGNTEAFPASPLECMACGVPVIASDDYGMSDCMRFFPELIINEHRNIVEIVEWLVKKPLRYREVSQRALSVAQWFASQTDQILTRWESLFDMVSKSSSEISIILPNMTFYGSKIKLLFRREIRCRLGDIKKFIVRNLQKFSV